jgi:hypothetical protein
MNNTELAYANYLYGLQLGGEIISYEYEPEKLTLAPNCTYTPDFLVIKADSKEFHEVKGFMRDDAAVKLKVAAVMFPEYKFILVKRKNGLWTFKEMPIK